MDSCSKINEIYTKHYAVLLNYSRKFNKLWAEDYLHDAVIKVMSKDNIGNQSIDNIYKWIYYEIRNVHSLKSRKKINNSPEYVTPISVTYDCNVDELLIKEIESFSEWFILDGLINNMHVKKRINKVKGILIGAYSDIPDGEIAKKYHIKKDRLDYYDNLFMKYLEKKYK